MPTSWHSYPKIFNFGHAEVTDLFLDPVIVEEKVDGSQFSFGVFDGELKVRSKGAEIIPDSPPKMFEKGVEAVKAVQHLLTNGWTYRGEYLEKPKHNTLSYDRTPKNHVVVFDINTAEEVYLSYEEKLAEAARIGFECVPLLSSGTFTNPESLLALLENNSFLGSQKIEGFVVKNYGRFGRDKKALMGKFVSEAFKEIHHKSWKDGNPTSKEIVFMIGEKYRTPARWNKAVQHLRDKGLITDSPKDIGPLMKEVNQDVLAECAEEIKKDLFSYAWKHISRMVTRGLPEYYKKQLLEKQFQQTEVIQ